MTSASTFGGSSGSYGNQFPSQNDAAYAPGDARNVFGHPPTKPTRKKKRNRKQTILRRNLQRVL